MANHRFIVDLNICGGQEVKIPSFTIGDHSADGKATYYNAGNTLDAVMPMSSVPVDTDQTADVSSRTNPTGSINTATFGFGSATDAQLTINSGDLTSSDITFSPDLGENKINFTLTSGGEQKLRAGDLTSKITIATSDASVKLTLKLTEPVNTWMPSTALQTALTNAGVGDLTKENLAKFSGSLDLTGISDLTGLEYDKNLTGLNLTGCNLYGDGVGKTTNSQVLSKLTGLTSLKIDSSQLGSSLAGWGLDKLTSLEKLIANNDTLSDSGTADYASDVKLSELNLSNNALTGDLSQFSKPNWTELSVLNLSNNALTGDLSQFSVADWTKLTQLQLRRNQLTGSIPASWSGLTNLSILDLTSNKLTGTFDNIAQLSNLSEIYLDKKTSDPDDTSTGNAFEGKIPAAWFTSKLTHFEANNNQLSGPLPDNLATATNLKWLDVANNQLTGKLPDLSNDKLLTTFAYSSNQITSGRAADGSLGTYQNWQINEPDWETSHNGQTMTLDLSKYYGGEQGQSDYRNLGIKPAGGQTGVTLNSSDPDHPLLTIDTTTTNVQNGDFMFYLFDQAKEPAVFKSNMNYMAQVTVPVTLAIPKTYAIDTGSDTGSEAKIGFGSSSKPAKVGAGMVPANNFKLGVSSTNAAGDSYQLTAQTSGLTANERTLPLYYGNGQHQTLLTSAAQSIYDYQPTTNDGTETIVGDSGDSTKGNLQTDIPSTTHTGTYTGDITYTLASAPADATTASSSDTSTITSATLSGLSPKLAALDATQEAVRAKLQTNMTSFAANQLADEDGVLYSSYKAGHDPVGTKYGTREELTETSGMWLLALANSGDATTFNTAFNAVVKRFYDSKTQTFNWQALGADHTVTAGSASIDDLRIIQALLVMNQKDPGNTRTAWINQLIDGFTKYDLNPYYQMIDGYSTANGQEKRIRLDYLDFATLKAIYEAKRLGTAGNTAYQQQLKLVKDSYISDQFPLFATYYDYSKGAYQVAADDNENDIATSHFNITDSLLTMLNLAKVGELPQTSLNWLKRHTSNRTIYNDYNLDGTPVSKTDAGSNYAYVAQIAAAIGDTDLYNQALTVMKSMTSDDDNSGDSKLAPTDPLYGSAQYGGESYAFNDLNMLLAYNSVAFGTTASGE